MSTYDEIRTSVRNWVVGTASTVPADRIIFVDQNGDRPELPYLTVSVTTHDLRRNIVDELREGQADGNPTTVANSEKTASVTVAGYGEGAQGDVELLADLAQLQSIQTLLDTNNLSVFDLGPVRYIPVALGMSREPRWTRDITVGYQTNTTPESGVAAETLEFTGDLYRDQPDDADRITVSISTSIA